MGQQTDRMFRIIIGQLLHRPGKAFLQQLHGALPLLLPKREISLNAASLVKACR